MKVTVDEDKCCGAGSCVLVAPDVFDQHDEDGIVVGASAAGLSTAEALRRKGYEGRLTLLRAEAGRSVSSAGTCRNRRVCTAKRWWSRSPSAAQDRQQPRALTFSRFVRFTTA